jgi:two-component system, chemotaxis family, sensor kinase CheA
VTEATGKKASLRTLGGELTLVRTALQALDAPLLHLVRNAVDHGAEPPAERMKAGKDPECHVVVQAYELPGELILKVSDDGRGIDYARVLEKALRMNAVAPGASLKPEDLANLLFLPGLSTAAAVTDISGRGVGMDVVKTNVEALGGHVEVSSRLGKGTDILLFVPNA